jgi:hypothetical protein
MQSIVLLRHLDDAAGQEKRQPALQDRVDDAEHRDVRADGQILVGRRFAG